MGFNKNKTIEQEYVSDILKAQRKFFKGLNEILYGEDLIGNEKITGWEMLEPYDIERDKKLFN